MMRENTDSEALFEKYTLSEETLARLGSIREAIKDSIAQANPLWKIIAGQNEEEIRTESEDSDETDEPMNNSESQATCDQSLLPESTQFYFTQVERTATPTRSAAVLPQRCDILECACENLERNNGRLDLAQLESLSDEDLVLLANEMRRKLSPKGTYNLCQSMSDMTVEQKMKYLDTFCTHLLLPKIIELEEPSRLLSSAVVEFTKIFPNDVQRFIFVPILNTELKDVTLVTTIVNTFDQQRKAVLLEYVLHSHEMYSFNTGFRTIIVAIRAREIAMVSPGVFDDANRAVYRSPFASSPALINRSSINLSIDKARYLEIANSPESATKNSVRIY